MYFLNEKGFNVIKEDYSVIEDSIKDIIENKNISLKNGFMIESLIDILIRIQSSRICNEDVDEKEINKIKTCDIIDAKEEFLKRNSII